MQVFGHPFAQRRIALAGRVLQRLLGVLREDLVAGRFQRLDREGVGRGQTAGQADDAGLFRDLEDLAVGARLTVSAREFLTRGSLAVDDQGFVRIDEQLRSVSHPQVFATGDCASWAGQALPTPEGSEDPAYLQRLIDALCELSLKDPLTGLSNRRHFLAALDQVLAHLHGDRAPGREHPRELVALRPGQLFERQGARHGGVDESGDAILDQNGFGLGNDGGGGDRRLATGLQIHMGDTSYMP